MVFFEPARKSSQRWLLIPVAVTFVFYHLMIYHLNDIKCIRTLEPNDQIVAIQSVNQSAAAAASSGSNNALRNIPKKIFMTVKDEEGARKLLAKVNSWGLPSDYQVNIMDNKQQSEWIKEHNPNLHDFFTSLNYDIQRSDFWRFMIIYQEGGFYFDWDVELKQPIDEWYSLNDTNGREINVLLGIEGDTRTRISPDVKLWREQQILSWTLAATPRHPLFEHFLGLLLNRPPKPKNLTTYNDDVGEFASPAILTDVVGSYLRLRGVKLSDMFDKGGNVFPDDKEDLYLAEVNAFACGAMWSKRGIRCQNKNKRIKVRHTFAGSWKGKPTK